jgi:hypothetical protein
MQLADIASALRRPDVELLYHSDTFAIVGDYHQYFYSFCVLNGSFYSLNARFPVLPYYRMAEPVFLDDQVFVTRYARAGRTLEPIDRYAIGRGGDPRVVSDGHNAYAVIILVEDNPRDGRKLGALVYDLNRRRTVPIQVEGDGFQYGKNWQPYLLDGELFIVHELTPLRVIKVDVESGRADILHERDISFKLPCFHTPYPMFRGGSNAVARDGLLLGVGRGTSQRYRHHPFLWCYKDVGELDILFTEFFYAFHKCGYNIIDPTSFFFDDGDLYLGLCCSERDWAHDQLVSNFLLRVPGCGGEPRGERLDRFLARRGSSESNGVPNLDRHLFFCIEMPSAAPARHEFGGRVSTGASGHLVHGPYIAIDRRGRFCAELSYLTKGEKEGPAGVFDIAASRVEGGRQVDFRILGAVDLPCTKCGMGKAQILFDTDDVLGALLEFRVYVHAEVELNAYHVRSWKVGTDDWPWSALHERARPVSPSRMGT